MKILIVNDDGVSAKGINVLARMLSNAHEVTVVAPMVEQRARTDMRQGPVLDPGLLTELAPGSGVPQARRQSWLQMHCQLLRQQLTLIPLLRRR